MTVTWRELEIGGSGPWRGLVTTKPADLHFAGAGLLDNHFLAVQQESRTSSRTPGMVRISWFTPAMRHGGDALTFHATHQDHAGRRYPG